MTHSGRYPRLSIFTDLAVGPTARKEGFVSNRLKTSGDETLASDIALIETAAA